MSRGLVRLRLWNRGRSRRDPIDYWNYYDDSKSDYRWFIQTLVALVIGGLVFLFHGSNTLIGQSVDSGIQYMMTTQVDFESAYQEAEKYIPADMDLAVMKKVPVISHTANPLRYMNHPTEGKLLWPYGGLNEGVAFEAEQGSSVRAAGSGSVKEISESARFGKTVILSHGQNIETFYGYLGEILVTQGELVSQGQVFARVGRDSKTNKSMLYFELRDNMAPVDPFSRIKGDFPSQ